MEESQDSSSLCHSLPWSTDGDMSSTIQKWGGEQMSWRQWQSPPMACALCWTGIGLEPSLKMCKRSLGCKRLVWLRVRVAFWKQEDSVKAYFTWRWWPDIPYTRTSLREHSEVPKGMQLSPWTEQINLQGPRPSSRESSLVALQLWASPVPLAPAQGQHLVISLLLFSAFLLCDSWTA